MAAGHVGAKGAKGMQKLAEAVAFLGVLRAFAVKGFKLLLVCSL